MFKFDMNRVLNGLEDLSTQEKIKALDKVYDQLEEVANEVSLTMAEIEEQYELVMLKKIDEAVNNKIHGDEAVISTPDSTVKVVVVPTDEELMIAMDTQSVIAGA